MQRLGHPRSAMAVDPALPSPTSLAHLKGPLTAGQVSKHQGALPAPPVLASGRHGLLCSITTARALGSRLTRALCPSPPG